MDFYINEAYLTDVILRTEFVTQPRSRDITGEELIDIIKQAGTVYSISNKDHPEFESLRNSLEQQGYIITQRSWWNGDRVIRPFTLNGIKFKKHDQFSCAAAMRGHLKFAKKYQRKKGGHDA